MFGEEKKKNVSLHKGFILSLVFRSYKRYKLEKYANVGEKKGCRKAVGQDYFERQKKTQYCFR